jgi:hypothetical protein
MFDLPIAALLARDAVARKLHDAPRSQRRAARHRVAERLARGPATDSHDRGPLRRRAAGTLRSLADRLDSGATAP